MKPFGSLASATVLLGIVFATACGREHSPTSPSSERPLLASSQPGEWSDPVSLGSVVNFPNTDNSPELSRDGLSLYFGSLNRPDGFGSTDLYVSQRACTDASDPTCAWGAPVNLGATINTSRIDGGPHLSRDGHWLYLISDRPGGFGSNDIWVSYRQDTHDDLAWEAPVNLGPTINTAALEAGPNLRGSEFYFHRGPGVGDTDIFLSHFAGGVFSEPEKVLELSEERSFEQRPSTRWDGHEMILSSDRPGTLGGQDLWMSTRQGNGSTWTRPVNLGPSINTEFQEQTPTINDDGTILLFSSNRTGNFELYMSIRTRRNEERQ
jgi:hypothetical protein